MHLHGALRSEANCVIEERSSSAAPTNEILPSDLGQASRTGEICYHLSIRRSIRCHARGRTREYDAVRHRTAVDQVRRRSGGDHDRREDGSEHAKDDAVEAPHVAREPRAFARARTSRMSLGFARPNAVLGGGFHMPRANGIGGFDARNRANREWQRSRAAVVAGEARLRTGPRCARCTAARFRASTPAPRALFRGPRSRAQRATEARGRIGAWPR